MPPTIVFPALYLGSQELLWSLRSMPRGVLPVVEPRFLERTGYDGPCLVDDFTDRARLFARIDAWCASNGRTVTGVLGIDDEDQFELSRDIARRYGVGFPEEATTDIASNKYLQKVRFDLHGVPTGAYALIDASGPGAGEGVGFPNVLKTLTGSGSEYVFLNRDPGELADNLRYLRGELQDVQDDPRYRPIVSRVPGTQGTFDPRREFLLEEFLEGDEFSCDFLIRDGRVSLLRLVKKLKGGALGSFAGFYLMSEVSASTMIDLDSLRNTCRRVAGALGVGQGVQMVDFVAGADGVLRVIETSIRPGFSAFVPLMGRLYGFTSLGVAARVLAGEDVRASIPDVEGLAVYLVADRPGRVARLDVSRLERARETVGVIDVHLYAKAGDWVTDAPHDHFDLILGYVLVRDPGRDRFERVAERVRGLCEIEMSPA